MGLIWTLARRDLRASWRRALFFMLSIATGVAAVVGVDAFAGSLSSALIREARTLLAADLQVTLNRLPSAEQIRALQQVTARGVDLAQNTELVSMVAVGPQAPPVLSELKAVQPGRYPFYGELKTEPQKSLAELLPRGSVLVGPDLLQRLRLQVGDRVQIGRAQFIIAGTVLAEPDRAFTAFSLGPRVLMNRLDLGSTGLIVPGSRVREVFLFRLPDPAGVGKRVTAEQVRADLDAAFVKQGARVVDAREGQPQVQRFLDRLMSFLQMVSLLSLIVAGLGVGMSMRVFLQQKLDSIATLKCLGAPSRVVVGAFLAQALLLGLIGSGIGLLGGLAIQAALPAVVAPLINVAVPFEWMPAAWVQGVLVGMGTAALFSWIPLLWTRQVKPLAIVRRHLDAGAAGRRLPLAEAAAVAVTVLALGALAAWKAHSLRTGLYFVGGLVAAALVLGAASRLFLWLARRLPRPRGVAARQALSNLVRPGSQAGAVILVLGLGVAVVFTVYLLQYGLVAQVRSSAPPDAPNLVFMGIQKEQAAPYQAWVAAQPQVAKVEEPVMLVPARLLRVAGQTAQERRLPAEDQAFFTRQFQITSAAGLPAGNEVIEGAWWTPSPGQALASVEESMARRLQIKVGDPLEFDVGGQSVRATVSNVRKVVWVRPGLSFFVILSPGTLERAPHSYVGLVRTHPGGEAALQQAAMRQFPNVTVLNVGDVLQSVQAMMQRIGLVVRFVAAFSIVAGLVVMAGSVTATRYQRLREIALLKTLGATRRQVSAVFVLEYAWLGLVAGVAGVAVASVAASILARRILEGAYVFEPLASIAAVMATALLTLLTGWLATAGVLARKPLPVLREEA